MNGWLSVISRVVPRAERETWRREWYAELAYYARLGTVGDRRIGRWWLVRRLMAAMQHAFWLRGQSMSVELFAQDVRQAGRVLTQRPAFTVAAVLTLAIGIGGATVIYSAMRAVFWRPLPYPQAASLVILSKVAAAQADLAVPNSVSPPDFADWREQSASFAAVAAIRDDGYALQEEAGAVQITGSAVTPAFFEVFGLRPLRGRVLTPADTDAGARPVIVLSHGLWQGRFGGDTGVVGRSIVIDGIPREVVGVMPRELNFPLGSEAWTPLAFTTDDLTKQRGAHYLTAVARLKPGVSLAAASAEMGTIGARLAEAYPRSNGSSRTTVTPLRNGIVEESVGRGLRLLLGAVGVVFLVACVNVSSLVLGMALGRTRDFAVRAALGATRFRLMRALGAESLLLALAGGAGGLLLALFGTRAVASLGAVGIPLLDETHIDVPVLIFAALATLGAACLFGMLPALQASRDLGRAIGAGGRTTSTRSRIRARAALVTLEIALAVALLIGAGLLARSFLALTGTQLGIDVSDVQTVSLSLPAATYKDVERRASFVEQVMARIRTRPDVSAAGAIFGLPLTDFSYFISASERDGEQLHPDDQKRLSVNVRVVTPGYFETLGIPFSAGRDFSPEDRRGAPPVVVVNERAARLVWPQARALGHRVILGTRLGLGGDRAGGEVIGVVGDVRDVGPALPARPTLYLAHAQFPMGFLTVAVRAPASDDLVAWLRASVAAVDPTVPVFRVRTMEQFASRAVAQPRLYLVLIAIFAAVAIALAAIGIYGVMAQNVAARAREMGIRLALGATRHDVVALVVRSAGRLAVIGLATGVVVAMAARGAVQKLLVGVEPVDAATYLIVGAGTLAVALIAAWVPARRAANVDPAGSLRAE